MTAENRIGVFGNGPAIELVRDLLGASLGIFSYKVQGSEHLKGINASPAVLCFFPHTSHLDPLSVRYASPKNLRKMEVFPAAADYWYRNKLMAIAGSLLLNNIPMERVCASGIEESIKIARSALDRGFSLVFSPEGTRTLKPLEERGLHTGPADIALSGGYPIIPIRLRGFDNIMPKGYGPKLLDRSRRWHVSVTFGEPISVTKIDNPIDKPRERKSLTHFLKQRFLEM